MSQIVDLIANSIARQEGYLPGTLAWINNNPGNLRSWGTLPTNKGYAVFPTPQAGWDALKRQVQLNIDRGLTLEEFFGGKPGVYGGYSPSADSNDPTRYAGNVSLWTGIPLGVPLNTLDPNSPSSSSVASSPPSNPIPPQAT